MALMGTISGRLIDLEEALKEALAEHAKKIGRDVKQLTPSERRQAFCAWILENKVA